MLATWRYILNMISIMLQGLADIMQWRERGGNRRVVVKSRGASSSALRRRNHARMVLPRHCERSEAIQPRTEGAQMKWATWRGLTLDCFVASAPRNDG
jgi:hypothetical protein